MCGLLFLALNRTPIHNHYFNSIFPLLFIGCGGACDLLYHKSTPLVRKVVLLVIGIIVLYQFSGTLAMLNFIKNNECISGDYGTPFKHRLEKINELVDLYGYPQTEEQFHFIHFASCKCTKCEEQVSAFLLRYCVSVLKTN
jgi:hypothetical protein